MGTLPPGTGNGKAGLAYQATKTKTARAFYDFAVDAGAVSNITLRGDSIPSGAIVTNALIDVETGMAQAANTVALTLEGAGDLRAAAAVAAGTPVVSTTGTKALIGANVTKTTAERSVVLNIATTAVTAGKFSVLLTYIELA